MDSTFARALAGEQFIVTAECAPPIGTVVSRLKACGAALGSSVHAVLAPESEDGVRLSSLAACVHLAAAGAEPVLHLVTRDLNRIALQSSLLGAASLGIKNVLCLSGRHQSLTSSPSARGVYDIDHVQLLQLANEMRKNGQLADRRKLDAPLQLVIGTDTNPFADPVELQVMALEKAANAGADFVTTQPVFDLKRFGEWMKLVGERGIHTRTRIIASVMPIGLSEESRRYDIPADLIDRLRTAGDRRTAAIHVATEAIDALRKTNGVRGVNLMAGDDFELAGELIKTCKLARS